MRIAATAAFVLLVTYGSNAAPPVRVPAQDDLRQRFATEVRPFVETYCGSCHGGQSPAAQFDLRAVETMEDVAKEHPRWNLVREKLEAGEMPPPQAKQPPPEARQRVMLWINDFRREEARRNAGDPGVVLARRLSNAEYNYTIRDLTAVDIRPAREFPVDPSNPAGFDNSGESLVMSPALLTKYLQAAQDVANHLVLKPDGVAFAPHPMLVDTDRDKYCVNQILQFYREQNTDYAAYFKAAWAFARRPPSARKATLAEFARTLDPKVSPTYFATIWRTLEDTKEDVGPVAKLQTMWRELREARDPDRAAAQMRDFVVGLRKKIEVKHTELKVAGISEDAQPFLMWRNRQYAVNRRSYDRTALKAPDETSDPDLQVPPAERQRYEAAFARFASIFPDAFYVSERGRYFPDNTRDVGRHLSAGFHNLMGYFRDDRPLYELLLDRREQEKLDALWQELEFIALATPRTYVQFYLSESGAARDAAAAAIAGRADDNTDPASPSMIQKVAVSYLERAKAAGDATAVEAIEHHFDQTNTAIRWVEKARVAAEPTHLAALQEFAARAYRRPLSPDERQGIVSAYHAMRASGVDHSDAIRDSVVAVLMSPDFCYRLDLAEAGGDHASGTSAGSSRRDYVALSDYALASRLSYFLWSSMPDAELLARAAAGDLQKPHILTAQARRMLKDPRIRGLATEFGGHWLDFRRFEEHNAVDRERFSSFDDDLRQAMFEEPVQFMLDVFREGRSVLDFLYASHTFVNPVLAKHYGMPVPVASHDQWSRVNDVASFGRGGLLPMAVFLTKNAPGLRTSPVKRGYWVVKQVLGEQIPPPPAVVPELPRDEAKLDLPLRDLLARHREDKSCASCHARFDSLGLVFEGYGPIGDRRTRDLSGRPVDASATFPGGATGSGVEGLRAYIRERRQDDFVNNLSRRLLAYALGRSLQLSDESTIDAMRAKLVKDGYRFDSLIESIVSSSQFRNKRIGELR